MKFEIILGRIFMALISLIVTFFIAEYAGRWFLPESSSPVEIQYNVGGLRKPLPYVMFGGAEYADFYALKGEKLNSLGYRGQPPSTIKAPGEYRIFMLGGSTVLLGDPPLPVLLQQALHREGFDGVKVFNYGVISSVSAMELARILHEISGLEPDLIIMYNGGNDIIQPVQWDPRPGYPFNYIAYENNPLLRSDLKEYPALSLLAYGSRLLRYAAPGYFMEEFVDLEKARAEAGYLSAKWKIALAARYVGNLMKADRITKAFDAEFISFFQPLVYYKDPPSSEEKGRYYERLPQVRLKEYAEEMRVRILNEVAAAKRVNYFRFVDLSDAYDGERGWVFSDYIHTRQGSKQVVAEKMRHFIINNTSLKGKATSVN